MRHKISTLKNGLRVLTTQVKDSPSVTACVFVGVGSRYEDFKTLGGVSHFLEHLLFKGTQRRPSTKIISEEIDSVGGYQNAWTSEEATNYYAKVPKEHLPLALDIFGDMIQHSLFDPQEVDRERNVVLEEMNVYRDDPARYVEHLIPPLLWPEDTLSQDVLGNEEVIKNIPRDSIVEYKERHYVTRNMVVSIAGSIPHRQAVKLAERYLSELDKSYAPKIERVKPDLASERVKPFEKPTNQAHFMVGTRAYPYYHKNEAAAKLLTTILGRGLSSRLFLNVRERKGLAYTVNAQIMSLVDTGQFVAYAGVNLDKIPEAIEAVISELELIRQEPVGLAELRKAKNQIRGATLMGMEENANIATRFGLQLVLTNKIETVKEALQKIDRVTAEDIQKVAGEMLDPQQLRLAIIAPKTQAAQNKFESLTR